MGPRRKHAPRYDAKGDLRLPRVTFFRSIQPKKVRVALRLDAEMGKFLRSYARENRLSVTESIVRALQLLQSQVKAEKRKKNGRKT